MKQSINTEGYIFGKICTIHRRCHYDFHIIRTIFQVQEIKTLTFQMKGEQAY